MPKRHAAQTTVSVGKSRDQIDRLLREWECDGVRWTDHFSQGKSILEFTWTPLQSKTTFMARFEILDPDEKNLEQGRRRIYRVLRIFLVGQFNAVAEGLVSLEEVFLSHIVGPNGQTIAQQLLPRMSELVESDANHLLLESHND